MIKYDLKTIEILNKLSSINKEVSLEIIEDKVYLFGKDPASTVYFTFKTSKSNFDFSSLRNKIHFMHFPDFYNSFKNLSSKDKLPTLELTEKDDQLFIDISIENSTMDFAIDAGDLSNELSQDDSGAKEINQDILVELDWNLDRAKKFKSMISAITKNDTESSAIQFSSDGTTLTASIVCKGQNSSFRETIMFPDDSLPKFSYKFLKTIFEVVPMGDYKITLFKGGHLQMDTYIDENTEITFQTYKVSK